MKISLWVIAAVVVVLLVGGVYFLTQGRPSSDNQDTNPASTPNSSPTANTHAIEISGFAFSPSVLTIKKGDTVVWTNQDSAAHVLSSDSGSEISSGSLSKGGTYSHTFASAGVFAYHCTIHPSMKAKVIVE